MENKFGNILKMNNVSYNDEFVNFVDNDFIDSWQDDEDLEEII